MYIDIVNSTIDVIYNADIANNGIEIDNRSN